MFLFFSMPLFWMGVSLFSYYKFYEFFKKLMNFIKGEEANWEYIKAKNSAVLKDDGETYYKIYEDGK